MAKAYKNPGPLKFTAVIKRGGEQNSWEYIDFPYDLKETFGVGNLVPYTVTFDGRVKYRGSLAKMGGLCAMIVFRKDIKEQLGKGAGETVEAVVELDDKPREVEIPKDVEKALQTVGQFEKFNTLSYTRRKEYVRWIEDAKRDETHTSRIEKMCAELAADKIMPH